MWINKSTMLAASVVLGGALVSGAAWLRRGELVVEAPLTQDERHRVVSPGSANARPTIDAALTGSVGHGFAFADFDDDGRLDVYVADPHRRLTRTQDCTVCHNVPEGFHPSRPQVRHRSASSLGNVTLRPWRDDYRVDQGDVLRFRLKLAGRDPEAAEHVVGPGGQISKLWSLGIDMNVRGMTSQEIKRQVVQELRRHLTDLELQLVKVDGGRLVAVKPEDCPVVDVAIAGFSSRVVVSVGGEGSVIDGVDGRAQASTGASIDQRLRGQEERLKALEAKLDRVLEAIEKQAARTR
jgi:hypothetical protein